MIRRRDLLRGLGAGALVSLSASLSGCAAGAGKRSAARVVIVGGGFGGATAAKYIRVFSNHAVDVLLIEPNPQFISSPLSNRVIAGSLELADITSSYEGLRRAHGVTIVQDRVARIDARDRKVTLAGGRSIRYDKLVLAPGIEPIAGAIEGLAEALDRGQILQSWVAGPETVALNRQLRAMRDGGVFAITIPESPYRCPPAPYERASLVAAYLKVYKPKSKVLVLDANQDVTAMAPLFKRAWTELYGGMLEYRNHYKVTAVDGNSRTARFELQEDERADVLNVLPPVRAGALAVESGLANVNARWCEVDFRSFASVLAKDIHVLGDSIQAAPMMPKSGHMANAHAKVAAAAIVAALQGLEIDPSPMLTNTCYSFVSASEAIHSTAVYSYAADARTFRVVSGASGVSAAPSQLEAAVAMAWAQGIWADTLS
jgi:NADPH-dependent 2,4-dienoyl-CoA reductase/sulfur reductase-like enzyme